MGVTAVANSETVAVNVDLSTNDAKGVQVKLTLAAGRTVQGYMDGTNGTINTDLGGGYGRVNATAMIPFGTKGAFNSIECPAAGIDGIDLVQ